MITTSVRGVPGAIVAPAPSESPATGSWKAVAALAPFVTITSVEKVTVIVSPGETTPLLATFA